MSRMYEEISFDFIGAGLADDDLTLKDLVNHEMQRLASLVSDSDRDGKGTITVRISVEENDSNQVVYSGTVTTKEPRHRPRELVAKAFEDGQVLTMQHQQLPIPYSVTPSGKEALGEGEGND